MNALIGTLLPLGVAAALSPMPLIARIITLFSKQRAANGFGFLLGSLIATAALTTIATLRPVPTLPALHRSQTRL